MTKKINFIIWFLFILSFIFRIYQFRSDIFTCWDPVEWQGRYARSQWVIPNSQEGIGDDGLYAVAGWQLIHGQDPTLINPEVPPLGKYLIGLTWLFFGNPAIFGILSYSLAIIAFWMLNKQLIKKPMWLVSLVTVLTFSQRLFWQTLRVSELDLIYLSLFLFNLYFFVKHKYYLTGIFLGLLTATKLPFLSGLTILNQFIFLIIFRKKQLKKWLIGLFLGLFIFVATYWRYILNGHGFLDVLRVQKWIFEFYRISQVETPWWQVLGLIWANRWYIWWESRIVKVEVWNLFWPASLIIMISSILKLIQKKFGQQYKYLFFATGWLVIYLIFLLLVPVWPRYLTLFLPLAFTNLALLLK